MFFAIIADMKKWVTWAGRILLGILILLIILVLSIHTAFVKKIVRNKLQSYLINKTHSEVRIGAINYRLPKWVELDGVFIRDKAGDTLLLGNKVRVDVNMFKLISGKIEISRIELDKVYANVYRRPNDSTYNFQFLIDAFAGKSPAPQPEPKKESRVSLSLAEIELTGCSFKWNDRYGGMLIATTIGNFKAGFDSIDIYTTTALVNKFTVNDMRFDMQMIRTPYNLLPRPVEDTIRKAGFPVVKVKRMAIARSHFSFSGEEQGIATVNDIGELNLDNMGMTAEQQISMDKIELLNSFLSVNRTGTQKPSAKTAKADTIGVESGLGVTVKNLRFYNNNIAYHDLTAKKAANGLDPHHIIIRSFNAAVSGAAYNSKQITANVDSLSMIEKSGFIIDTMHGSIDMRDSVIYAKNLLLKTPYSRVAGDARIYPASFADNYKGNEQNTLVFNNNIIARKDIELLAPSITAKYRKQLQGISTIYVTANGAGNAKKMVLKTVSLHSNKNDVNVVVNGTLWNATSPKALMYDMNITRAVVSKSFIDPFVNTGGKQTVNFPPTISINGKVKGDMKNLVSDLAIKSAYGDATVKGSLKNFTDIKKLTYNMRLVAKELETGKWINKDSMLGKLNGTVMINGSGIDYKTANMQFAVDLSSFRLQQHVYTGIHVKGKGNSGVYDVMGDIKDSLLNVTMDVNTALGGKYPTATGKISVGNADLYALGFYTEPFRFRSDIDLQVKDLTPDGLNALVRLDSTILYTGNKIFRVDSVVAKGIKDSGQTLLTLRSPFADAMVKGDYRYDELPAVLQHTIARYTQKTGTTQPAAQQASFDLVLDAKQDSIYALLLPGLFFDKNIHATGRIDTKQKDSTLYFYITAPVIKYKDNRLSKLDAKINGGDSLRYAIVLDTVHASSVLLYSTSISGGIGKGNYSAKFITKDEQKKDKYALGVTAATEGDAYKIHLSDSLKLNYDNWIVDSKNQISYSPAGINISQFRISKGTESIAVNSQSAASNAPIDITIDKFSLTNITGLMNRDSLEIAGLLNAQVKVEGLDKKVPLFNGNVKVDSLAYQGQSVGNIVINAKNEGEQGVAFDGGLTGNGNNVTLKGTYDQDKINAKVDLAPIELQAIQPFTGGQLTRSSGKATGSITVTGSVSAPEWNGSVRFDSAFTQLAKYGTVLKLDNTAIDLKYPEITLNKFTIRDSLNHPLVIDGKLRQENGTFNTDLTVKTRNFYALNNNAIVNSEIYGTAVVDVDVAIKGPATTPDITGKVALKENSQVTYVRQQNVTSAKDREKVMEFVDMDTIKNLVFKPTELASTKKKPGNGMLNYTLDIDIDKNAKFSVIIDPITRDELMVQGAGQITAGVQPNGDISLTGAYNLTKGSYQLNYKFLKRKFDLQEGSTIVLSGDPMNAEANITAIYNIEAVPYDLIANEVSDQTTSVVYRQKLPFQVLLMIKGKVLQPEITFDIQLAKANGINSEMQNTIDNKFQQMRGDASTMNKQVFALLVMGRFIGEQSKDFFASSSGDGLKADAVVKESVSRFLSDAVSQIAADLIKGVDVDVNLKTVDNYSDQSQRTDLNLALSKRFLNDRLNISVGKSFTVDGEDPLAKGQDNNNVSFLPDITTTYKLSKDGRYMLKAYQKSDYEAILDGYFIETGVAFTLTMDYNRFKELFEKNKKGSRKGQEKGKKTDKGMEKTVAEKNTDKNEDKKN